MIVNVTDTFIYLLMGAFLGAIGQSARVVVGIKHELEANKSWKGWFNLSQLLVSLIIGAVAGSLGAVLLLGETIDKQFLLTLIAVGYSGADFIEGFMKSKITKLTDSAIATPETPTQK